mgnify:CR=1 FL=1
MDLVPLNLCVDTDLIPFNLRDFEEEEDSMNTYIVVEVLNSIIDMPYEAIDVLIADYDLTEVEEDEQKTGFPRSCTNVAGNPYASGNGVHRLRLHQVRRQVGDAEQTGPQSLSDVRGRIDERGRRV